MTAEHETMPDSTQDALNSIIRQLRRIETMLIDWEPNGHHPEQNGTVTRLRSTSSGPEGQVVPGDVIISGSAAAEYYATFKNPTLVPLSDLPPWTHIALANGSWWLLEIV